MKTIAQSIREGLPDLCADLFSFALQLRRSADPGEAEPLRMKIDELFRTLDTRARQADVSQEDVQLAKYAIAAFIDEMILTSQWTVKEAWIGQPLQLQYFNEFSAGEEFYNKLEGLRNAPDRRKAGVLEVYYTCLALGFRGKYADLQGMEKKKLLVDSISRELRPAQGEEKRGLSPEWETPDEIPMLVKNFPAWIVAVGCAAFLLLLFILLSSILGGSAGGVVEKLG